MTRKTYLLFLMSVICFMSAGLVMSQRAQKGITERVLFSDLSYLNQPLANTGMRARVLKFEYVTAPGSGEYGATVFAKDVGNKQLDADWVPFDPGRGGNRLITYIQDTAEAAANGGVSGAQTATAIDNAMTTWNGVTCSTIPVVKLAFPAGTVADLGVIQYLLDFGGSLSYFADITHAGWLGGDIFDLIEEGGSDYIVAITFTFIWVDGDGNPVDQNRDGKLDVAFREIYYNNAFVWSVDAPGPLDPEMDVETVALHEAGHGFSQAHFGFIFYDGYGTKTPGFQIDHLHFAPEAVMNAIVWGTKRELRNTDIGGHCSIWADWPLR